MNKIQHTHVDTREHLLATGERLSLRLGFNGMGLSLLLTTAGIPKGSFYHYFRSKEVFGEAMLQRYFDRYDAEMESLLAGSQGDKRHHLLHYLLNLLLTIVGVNATTRVWRLNSPLR